MKLDDGYMEAAKYSPEINDDLRRAPQHIRGIRCDVSSCVYHDGEKYCCAERINVGPSYARNALDTVCATYRPKFDG